MGLINISNEEKVSSLVRLLNDYKKFIEYDLIFLNRDDFLYRQKGQLKLDNTILEEFLPIAVYTMFNKTIDESTVDIGPTKSFSGLYVTSPLSIREDNVQIIVKQKDQDFAISKRVYFAASHNPKLEGAEIKTSNVAYMAAECKTNLDKTMFQEAAATALSLKTGLPSAKYFLICEWLDMTPISASTTAIDEVIVLRKAKRLGSESRSNFSTFEGRIKHADFYLKHLESNPIDGGMVTRFIKHAESILQPSQDESVIARGYF